MRSQLEENAEAVMIDHLSLLVTEVILAQSISVLVHSNDP